MVDEGDMTIRSMLTVLCAILLCAMGIADAQMAFPMVAQGGKAVERIFEGETLYLLMLLPETALRASEGIWSGGSTGNTVQTGSHYSARWHV